MPACSCEHGAVGVRTYVASTTANVVVLSIAVYSFASGSLLAACTAHARTHACTLHLHCYICMYVCLTASFMHSHCMSPHCDQGRGGNGARGGAPDLSALDFFGDSTSGTGGSGAVRRKAARKRGSDSNHEGERECEQIFPLAKRSKKRPGSKKGMMQCSHHHICSCTLYIRGTPCSASKDT